MGFSSAKMCRASFELNQPIQNQIEAIVCISAKKGLLERYQLHKLSKQGAILSSGYSIPCTCSLQLLAKPESAAWDP